MFACAVSCSRILITAVLYERLGKLSPLLALLWCSQHIYATPPPQDRLCCLDHALLCALDRVSWLVNFRCGSVVVLNVLRDRLAAIRCVSLQHVLRFHIVSMLYLAPVAVEGA